MTVVNPKTRESPIDFINRIAAEYGLGGYGRRGVGGKSRHKFNLWRPPRGWKPQKGKGVYRFGYTPWKTCDSDTGKTGYFALKYRVFKNGTMKLVKSVRFGKRKTAKARATQWYWDYYNEEDN